MPREVSDEEYMFLRGRDQIASFVESIYNDPQLNREAKALIKKKYPQIQIPDYDIEAKVEKRLDEDRRMREDAENQKRNEEEQRQFQTTRQKVQDQYGFTPEGMEKLEKFMVEKNVGDYDVAASYMASKEPRQSEATLDNFRWNHDKAPGFAEIAKDPEAWGRQELITAIHKDTENQRGGR